MNRSFLLFSALALVCLSLTGCGVSERDISTKTFGIGYYYLFFKSDHSIEIYQSTGSSAAKGCTAEGKWSIEDGKLKIEVVQSYCGTETYTKFNGLYEYNGECIKNERFILCD